jgi:hypothetical protein
MGKNWKAISEVPSVHLRMALIEVRENSDLGVRLERAFPTCFEGAEYAQVPLSTLVREGWNIVDRLATEPEIEEAAERLGVPTLLFALDDAVSVPKSLCTLPHLWRHQRFEFGTLVDLFGQKFVVLDVIANFQVLVSPVAYVVCDTTSRARNPHTA